MAEYIPREAAIDRLNENWKRTNEGSIAQACYSAAIDSIMRIPAADVVEVVRCRDCVYRIAYGCKRIGGISTPPNWYCAAGERRGGGQDDV